MNYLLMVTLNFTIAPAAILGMLRWRQILPADRPFIWLLWLGTLNEAVMVILAKTIRNNIIAVNIYELFDAYLIARTFYNWGCFYRKKWIFDLLMLLLIAVWLRDNHSVPGLFEDHPLFRVVYSCLLVFMGIDRINAFMITERRGLLQNGRFLIALAMVTSCSYEGMQDVITWIYPPFSEQFYDHLFAITSWEMVFVNSLLIVAVIRLPRREAFLLDMA